MPGGVFWDKNLEKFIHELSETYGIEVSEVKGHKEVSGEHTLCPGSRLDLDALRLGLGRNITSTP